MRVLVPTDPSAQKNGRQQSNPGDHKAGNGGACQALVRGKPKGLNRQRVEIERPKDQRGRQFFHHIDKHDQRTGQKAGGQKRQVNLRRSPHRRFPKNARGMVQILVNRAGSAFIGAQGGGKKPNHIGHQQKRDRPGDQQSGLRFRNAVP